MVKKLLLGVVGMVLVLGVFAAPVASADPTASRVLIVNGLPARVDICVGSVEVFSNLRYRRAVVFTELPAGAWRFVIRVARAGSDCNGRRLAITNQTFDPDGNYSLVIWRPYRAVAVKRFVNDVSLAAPNESSVIVRHVARMPSFLDVWLWEHVSGVKTADSAPTLDNLPRGASSAPIAIRPGQFYADFYPSRRTRLFSWEGYWGAADPGTVTELYLVGTAKANYAVVGFRQAGVVSTP